ncbi:MAG: hypothetical protein IJL52_09295 [Clostridia bacterium]|nr:hypothetical protein [Clostridia bacterium]
MIYYVKNAIRCKKCGDVIESRYTHDFKMCSCGAVGVDGGHEYQRLIGELEDIENLSIVEEQRPEKKSE